MGRGTAGAGEGGLNTGDKAVNTLIGLATSLRKFNLAIKKTMVFTYQDIRLQLDLLEP